MLRLATDTEADDQWVVDYFAGSGTTGHAVIGQNHEDKAGRRFLLVECNQYFETLLIPRLKRASVAPDLKKIESREGPGLFLRVQRLEQYDDCLESLDTEPDAGDSADLPFDDPALALRYRLDRATRRLYCSVKRFGSPLGYQLRRADGGGEARPCAVDLMESLVYLLGLDIERLYREPLGVVLLGRNRRGQTAGIFFRECDDPGSPDWVAAKLVQHPADRVYTNDPATLGFAGGERLEAIEAIFALQFAKMDYA